MHELLERFLILFATEAVFDTRPGEVARRVLFQLIMGWLAALVVGVAVALLLYDRVQQDCVLQAVGAIARSAVAAPIRSILARRQN